MNQQAGRRRFLQLIVAGVCGGGGFGRAAAAEASFSTRLAALEGTLGAEARLGVAVLDTHSGALRGRRLDERFPLCSTFKPIACAALLAQVEAGALDLAQPVAIRAEDLVSHSPLSGPRVGGTMSFAELCAAALTHSDNTAGNLILRAIGGPAGLTAYARTLGDTQTRLDRWETALNAATPGDARDTTTPAAMARLLHTLLLGERLAPAARAQLIAWLLANRTGDAKLRAGLPPGWRIGDKTGGGEYGTSNDVAIIWPGPGPALIVCVYLTQSTASFAARDQAIAEVARMLAPA